MPLDYVLLEAIKFIVFSKKKNGCDELDHMECRTVDIPYIVPSSKEVYV